MPFVVGVLKPYLDEVQEMPLEEVCLSLSVEMATVFRDLSLSLSLAPLPVVNH